MPSETKMAPGRRDRGVVYVKVFDWLSWFPCMWTACDHHSLLLQWRHMTVWPLMWLVQLWHITIWPLMWLVQLWKVPRKPPLLAFISRELAAKKWNCLDGTPVASDCLSLTEGLGWWTAGSPLLGTPRLCWGKFHCLSLSAEHPPHHFMVNRWGNNGNSERETLFLRAPKSLKMVTPAMKLKDTCSLE